jgi:hypothetical protein
MWSLQGITRFGAGNVSDDSGRTPAVRPKHGKWAEMASRDSEAEKVTLIVSKTIREQLAELEREIAKTHKHIQQEPGDALDAERYARCLRERNIIQIILARQLTDAFPAWGEPGRTGWSSKAYSQMLKAVREGIEGTSPT